MPSFIPRGVLDEILNLIESVPEDFPSYSYRPPRSTLGQPKDRTEILCKNTTYFTS